MLQAYASVGDWLLLKVARRRCAAERLVNPMLLLLNPIEGGLPNSNRILCFSKNRDAGRAAELNHHALMESAFNAVRASARPGSPRRYPGSRWGPCRGWLSGGPVDGRSRNRRVRHGNCNLR